MMAAGKNQNTAITTCAREIAYFIWEMATGHIEDQARSGLSQVSVR